MVFGVNHKEEKNWIKADLYLEKNLRPDQLEGKSTSCLNHPD